MKVDCGGMSVLILDYGSLCGGEDDLNEYGGILF